MKTTKAEILKLFIRHFQNELDTLVRNAKTAHEDATHEEAQAEDRHDTQAIEASYLAMGQAKRVYDLERTLEEFNGYLEQVRIVRKQITPGTLVTLQGNESPLITLFALTGGGQKVTIQGSTISITTPLSPLGQALEGAAVSEEIAYDAKNETREYRILVLE